MNKVVQRLLEVCIPAVHCRMILLQQKVEMTREKIDIDLKIMWNRRIKRQRQREIIVSLMEKGIKNRRNSEVTIHAVLWVLGFNPPS